MAINLLNSPRQNSVGGRYGSYDYSHVFHRRFPDEHLIQTLEALIEPGSSIAELGCNAGNNAIPLAQNYKVYGVDLSRALLDKLLRQARATGVQQNITVESWDFAKAGTLPWEELVGKLKAIYSVHVLSHLSAKRFIATMQNLQQYLASGGVFVVSILDRYNYTESEYELRCGYVSHSLETVEKAFQGLKRISEFSRPFNHLDHVGWALPESFLRWEVFQKPLQKVGELLPPLIRKI